MIDRQRATSSEINSASSRNVLSGPSPAAARRQHHRRHRGMDEIEQGEGIPGTARIQQQRRQHHDVGDHQRGWQPRGCGMLRVNADHCGQVAHCRDTNEPEERQQRQIDAEEAVYNQHRDRLADHGTPAQSDEPGEGVVTLINGWSGSSHVT